MEYVKFGKLDHCDKMNLFAAWLNGVEIESSKSSLNWGYDQIPYWSNTFYYRTKPVKLTKPTVNWNPIHIDYNWIATDKNNKTYLYVKEPRRHDTSFNYSHNENFPMYAGGLASYRPGTCNWEDSLSCRPGHEDETCGL